MWDKKQDARNKNQTKFKLQISKFKLLDYLRFVALGFGICLYLVPCFL